jgi:arylsulfatase A-like enzyme
MFASWPGRIPAGAQDTRIVAAIDIAPTVFEASGITPTHTIDGHSLLSSYARTHILTEYWHEGKGKPPTWASIRTNTGLYMEDYESGLVTFTEFYDLVQDPWQLENLSVPPPGWPEQLAADRACAGVTCP